MPPCSSLAAILPHRIEARARLPGVQVVMAHDEGAGEVPLQLAQQGQERCLLFRGAGVGGMAGGGESAFVADAHGVAVVAQAVGTDFFEGAAAVDFAVAGDVEVVADVAPATVTDVVTAAVLKAQAHALGRGRAMNDK